jgi:alpha-L-rhamnosidase
MLFGAFLAAVSVASAAVEYPAPVDVAVVGGGTSGIAAALTASAAGAKTVVIERSDSLGGTMTRGGVAWSGLFHAWGRQVIAGPGWELVKDACLKSGFELPDFTCETGPRHWEHQVRFKGEIYEELARERLKDAGVEVRYGCEITEVKRTADGWRIAWSGGSLVARQIVDCTGNATVAAICGAERARGEVCQPGSYAYVIDPGCDLKKIDSAVLLGAWDKALASGLVLSTDCLGRPRYLHLGEMSANHIVGADNSTAVLRAEADRRGRESMARMLSFFRAQPGLENAHVSWAAKETGVRETYRIIGETMVTEADYLSGRIFADAVCYSFYPIDIHTSHGVKPRHLEKGRVPTVPFGCLIPKGVENLLVAGRAVSSDRAANSALRVQATCIAEGQVAGVAAALAAKCGITPRKVPLEELRRGLRAHGAIVPVRSRWISGDTKDRMKSAPWLEKVFSLEKAPVKAVLTLAVAGWHEVYVNGARIGEDVLSPVTCQPDKRISSVSHDVTAFLRQGENRLSVLLGNGWFNCFTHEVWGFKDASWMKEPMIRGELVSDGKVLFVTDGSWTAFDSPITFNALRGGEDYDARREGVRGNPRAATVVKYTPSGAVSPEDAVPCRAFEPIGPKRIFRSGDGATIYDFGSNRTGWCELEVVGEPGATVTLDYDETLSPSNTLKGHILSLVRDGRKLQRDVYTLAGHAKGETWHPRFTYHGFRYVRVQIKGRAEVKTLRSVFVHSAFDRAGTIRTSDPLFARLQSATMRSYLSNFTGIPTDCPHREKNGWTGDAQLAMETGMWNWKARNGYVHFLRMMLDAQRPDGAVPCILPCSEKFGFYWGSGPAWDAVLFEVPWQIWRFEGDDAVAKEAWPAMKRYLAFIDSKADEKGLVEYGLGDWCAPGDIGAPPVRFTDSCFVYEFNRRAAFWADRFGEKEAAVAYRARTKELKAAINEAYYKGDGLYADGRLTSLAAPLYFKGLCADGEEEKVFGRLLAKIRAGKHTCGFGILGAKWVPRVLASRGAIDDAWKIFTQRSQPGYQWWLDQGEDTLWETFDGSVSHNHIMFGDLSAWAYEHVAGIIPLEPGFRKIRFAPHCPEGVATFEAWHLTPHGEIRAGWRLGADGRPEYFCEAPVGVEVVRER